MKYISTRGRSASVTASQAVLQGLAPDGGLYVPEEFPTLPCRAEDLKGKSYQEIARLIMGQFLTDYTEEELEACVNAAYDSRFDTPEIAPLVKKNELFYLELYHGATIAFKDMALSILPHLMVTAAGKNNQKEEIVILTATSGDTGKAAMAGFADVPGTRILVFYPKDGVSPFQERQMRTQPGLNTYVAGIKGNFDDAQTSVKELFGDAELRAELKERGFVFSSANSINIGRLVPQVVYYVATYVKLLEQNVIQPGEAMNVTVPTGNFGNILAAYYAKKMGIPVGKLICASNENKVLFDFFETGIYDKNRPFVLTTSPSMDILVSSNLERLIFEITGRNAAQTSDLMNSLKTDGKYEITADMRAKLSDFEGRTAAEEEVTAEIRRVYDSCGYVIDPHTAVASAGAFDYVKKSSGSEKDVPMVVVSTASPCKFSDSVLKALGLAEETAGSGDLEKIDFLAERTGIVVPQAVEDVRTAEIRHNRFCTKAEMKDLVREILK